MKTLLRMILSVSLLLSCAACAAADPLLADLPDQEIPLVLSVEKIPTGQDEAMLSALMDSGIILDSWDTPDEIPKTDGFVHLYYILGNEPYNEYDWEAKAEQYERTDEGYTLIPAEELEAAILERFDVSADHVRTSGYYVPEKNAYAFGGTDSMSSMVITGVTEAEGVRDIAYEAFRSGEPIGGGILRVRVDADGYKYLSNEFEELPTFPE